MHCQIFNPALFIFFLSCTGSKHTEQTSVKQKFVVSFFSPGDGIDYKKKLELDAYIASFEKKENLKLDVHEKQWGKEGERDYCIDLKALGKKKRESFVSGAKAILSSSNRVNISEADSCKQ